MNADKKTILLVDEDTDLLAQLSTELEAQGYDVVAAHGEAEAEQVLERLGPDLAVVDVVLEHMDSGFVLGHAIRKRYPQSRVVLLTSVASDTGLEFDVTSARERSWTKADALLDKPVRPEQLTAVVGRLLHA